MITLPLLKIAGLSALLSAGVVTAYDAPQAPAASGPKVYNDRVAPDLASPVVLADAGSSVRPGIASDAVAPAPADCRAQAWPYVSQSCVFGEGGASRKIVRTITIERRDLPHTSTLVRVPVAGN